MRLLRYLCGLVLVLALLLSLHRTVYAHANFVRSDPPANTVLETAPERLQIWLSEPLEPGFSEVQVLDANGKRVDQGDSRVHSDDPASMVVSLQPLERGIYTVVWKALSTVDGHVTRGSFTFSIGVAAPAGEVSAPTQTTPYLPFESLIRWISYFAMAALMGALTFHTLILRPATGRQQIAVVIPAIQTTLHRLLWSSWIVVLLSTLAALVLQIIVAGEGAISNLSTILGQLLLTTRYGKVWLARAGLVLGLGLVVRRISHGGGPFAWRLGPVLGGALLLTTSLNSHSAAVGEQTILAVAADWLHLIAVSIWVGGLLSLALVLPQGLKPLQPAERRQLLARSISRFSILATASVGVLIATGTYQAWLHIGSVSALLETLYGKSLLVKLSLVLPLLLIGAANLLIIRPRLAATTGATDHSRAMRLSERFARLVRAEVVLAVLVLLVTGALTSIAPGRQIYEQLQAQRPLVMQSEAQDLQLTLTIAPARPGLNTFTISVQDPDGRPVDDAERVSLAFTYLDKALGTTVEIAEGQGEGKYTVQAPILGLEGNWQTELLVRRTGMEDARTAFRFLITPTSAQEQGAEPAAESGFQLPALGISMLAALVLVLLGLGLVVYVVRTVSLRSLEGRVLLSASVLIVGVGLFLAIRLQPGNTEASTATQALRNPFSPTEQSLAMGERLYRANCQTCHGESGRGDGPAAASLDPKPADFRVHLAAGHTDGELFTWVHDGIGGTAMPAFGERLSEDEIWHVINFLKTFAPTAR